MSSLLKLTFAVMVIMVGSTLAVPITFVQPGNASDIVITKENTVNATAPASNSTAVISSAINSTALNSTAISSAVISPTAISSAVINSTTISSTVISSTTVSSIATSSTGTTINNSTSIHSTVAHSTAGDAIAIDATSIKTVILATEQLPLAFVNNFAGGALNAYVTGLDVNDNLVMLQPDGSFYYPTCDSSDSTPQSVTGDVSIPLGAQGSTTTINMPGYISSARIWFAEGDLQFFTVWNPVTNGPSLVEPSAINPSDPSADVNWGFVELTNTEAGGLYANISYVDFVGLVLGMQLFAGDGSTQTAQGLQPDSVATICGALIAQSLVDGQEWGNLCQADSSGNPLRVVAPSDYTSLNPSAFESYWTEYIDQVWSQYTTEILTIDTQGDAGEVACTVQDGELTCDGDNRGYAQPVAADIFGCNSGPFAILAGDNDIHQAIVPRLCAAFDRSTMTMDGGSLQPSLDSSSYYTTTPTNWYSKLVHENEIYDGKGYAFSYDDVNPDGENQSGVVAAANPQLLTVIIGGPSS